MAVEVGMVLGGKYRLLDALGEGAMGSVWLAENELLSSRVAVKVLRADLASTDARKRFEQEARGVASLDSPHVVRVFDVGETDDGHPYLVMEYLRGQTLLDRIQGEGLTREEASDVVTQIARALTAAHDEGIVHRDLKPANVYVADAAGAPFVKVLDFGIAKHTRDDLELTDTGALMGTPYYMSPEQFISPRDIDHRADLWGLAVIAYACLLARLPFQGETVGALSLAVHNGDFARPTDVDPTLPDAIDAFFETALNPEPTRRFESAAQLAQRFDEALDGVASARSSSSPAPLSPPASDPTLIDETLLEATATHADTTTPTSIEKPAPVEERRWWPAAAIMAGVAVAGLGLAAQLAGGPEQAAATQPSGTQPSATPPIETATPPATESSATETPTPPEPAAPITTATSTTAIPSPDRATAAPPRPRLQPPPPPVAPPSPSVSSPKARSQW